MPTAKVEITSVPTGERCFNCGSDGKKQVRIITANGHLGWRGCEQCWPREQARNPDVLREMLRTADHKGNRQPHVLEAEVIEDQ